MFFVKIKRLRVTKSSCVFNIHTGKNFRYSDFDLFPAYGVLQKN